MSASRQHGINGMGKSFWLKKLCHLPLACRSGSFVHTALHPHALLHLIP